MCMFVLSDSVRQGIKYKQLYCPIWFCLMDNRRCVLAYIWHGHSPFYKASEIHRCYYLCMDKFITSMLQIHLMSEYKMVCSEKKKCASPLIYFSDSITCTHVALLVVVSSYYCFLTIAQDMWSQFSFMKSKRKCFYSLEVTWGWIRTWAPLFIFLIW